MSIDEYVKENWTLKKEILKIKQDIKNDIKLSGGSVVLPGIIYMLTENPLICFGTYSLGVWVGSNSLYSFLNNLIEKKKLELFQEESNLIARYRSYPILVDHDSECEQEIIAEDVHRLTFSYAFRENGKILWQPEFDAVVAETIPLAIRMDVEFANGERLSFLRRTAGNSANSSYGKFRKNTYAK